MSLVTISPKKPGRVYHRAFDHDEAQRLRAEDPKTWTFNRLAEHFDVSITAMRRVLVPSYRAKVDRRAKQWVERNRRLPCKGGCGRRVWMLNKGRSGYCPSCLGKVRARTVRPDTLLCTRCNEWKPDEDFPRGRNHKARRGRHGYCRLCNTKARREFRQRNPEQERKASKRALRRKQERNSMATFIVLQRNGRGYVEVDRVEAGSASHAVEKAAKEEGEYVAVPEARFKTMRVAPVQAFRVVDEA